MKMTVAGVARSRTDRWAYLKTCPPLSKWLFGIPEQDRSILEQEAKELRITLGESGSKARDSPMWRRTLS
jgi:hypothetical protein